MLCFFASLSATEIYTLSLHDALPISSPGKIVAGWQERDALRGQTVRWAGGEGTATGIDDSGALMVETRSEEHTSELQSRFDLVCRLLLEKKKEPTDQCMNGHHLAPLT